MKYSIHLVGVGGQGVLIASSVIGRAAMNEGFDVAMSEVHGMAQRGGSVASSVRFGRGVLSPLIPKGGADILIGFEPSETYRSLSFANSSTWIITNVHPIFPVQVSMGNETYPEVRDIIGEMKTITDRVIAVDATDLAVKAGKAIAANSVMIGAVSAVEGFPLSKQRMMDALFESIPEKHKELNRKAFQLGYDSQREAQQP